MKDGSGQSGDLESEAGDADSLRFPDSVPDSDSESDPDADDHTLGINLLLDVESDGSQGSGSEQTSFVVVDRVSDFGDDEVLDKLMES